MSRVTIHSHLPGTVPVYARSPGEYEPFTLKTILVQIINYMVTLLMRVDKGPWQTRSSRKHDRSHCIMTLHNVSARRP